MSDSTKNQPAIANIQSGDKFFQSLAEYIISQYTKEEVKSLLSTLESFIKNDSIVG